MHYLVFDVGGTQIKYALMSANATILEKSAVDTPMTDFDAFSKLIVDIYHQYENQTQGIAFSLPGIIDSGNGISVTGGSLTYNNQRQFIADIRKHCPLPISIENDAKCAVLAECWHGALENVDNAVVVVLGTGVGGGILINGELYKGANFAAGEFSFLLSDRMHRKGEAYHYWGFDGSARSLCLATEQAKGLAPNTIDGKQVFTWAMEKDPAVIEVLDHYTYDLAMKFFSLQALFDPEVIAVGGGMSANPLLMKYIEDNILYLESHLPIHLNVPKVVRCHYMNDANLIGALHHHLNQQDLPIP